jgi:hypothetical protein
VVLTRHWEAHERDCWGSWYVPSQDTKRTYKGQTCGEILPARGYHKGREDLYKSFPGLVRFKLVAPPLHLGVVEPYLVQGA